MVCFTESCSVEGAVRLIGGPRDGVGRIEYCSGGLWSTTCRSTFSASSASVACKQLGYSSLGIINSFNIVQSLIPIMPCIGAVVISATEFGYGARPMYSFSCSGSETALNNCTLTSSASCYYTYQAAVRCAG